MGKVGKLSFIAIIIIAVLVTGKFVISTYNSYTDIFRFNYAVLADAFSEAVEDFEEQCCDEAEVITDLASDGLNINLQSYYIVNVPFLGRFYSCYYSDNLTTFLSDCCEAKDFTDEELDSFKNQIKGINDILNENNWVQLNTVSNRDTITDAAERIDALLQK